MTTARAGAASSAKSPGALFGSAVLYDVVTELRTPFGPFDEVIAPGALRPALARADAGAIAFLRDHNASLLLARYGSGTLSLIDGPSSLRVRAELPPTELGEETIEMVRRRDLSGMSFAFTIGKATWYEPKQRGGNPLRVIEVVDRMYDVAAVTYPAYPTTTLQIDTGENYLADARSRALSMRMAITTSRRSYGRRCTAPSRIDAWSRQRPVRVGREARANLHTQGA